MGQLNTVQYGYVQMYVFNAVRVLFVRFTKILRRLFLSPLYVVHSPPRSAEKDAKQEDFWTKSLHTTLFPRIRLSPDTKVWGSRTRDKNAGTHARLDSRACARRRIGHARLSLSVMPG